MTNQVVVDIDKAVQFKKRMIQHAVNEIVADEGVVYVLAMAVEELGHPMQFAREGFIIYGISSKSVTDFQYAEDGIRFNATFSGKPYHIHLPYQIIYRVYDQANIASGVTFELFTIEVLDELEEAPATEVKKPTLKLVN